MTQANPTRAIAGGFVATLVMTMMIYLAPHMGMPNMDIAGMIGSRMNGGQVPAALSGAWWLGLTVHFLLGTLLFPLLYAYFVYGLLPGQPWVRGVIWGGVLWLVNMGMVMPMMGKGFFASGTPQPVPTVVEALIGHLIYGAILGAIAGPQAERLQGGSHTGSQTPV
jgi:hypothetical protein